MNSFKNELTQLGVDKFREGHVNVMPWENQSNPHHLSWHCHHCHHCHVPYHCHAHCHHCHAPYHCHAHCHHCHAHCHHCHVSYHCHKTTY